MPTSYSSSLLEKIPRVADIVSFELKRPEGYQFQAGQWFVITFPHPPGDPYTHHFSHSNSPTDPALEFTTRLRGTEFKNAVDALPIGAQIEVMGPFGSFVLPAAAPRVAFLTGGIGITCVRSMLRYLASEPSDVKLPDETILLFANRKEDGIPFRDELAGLEATVPGLRVIHVLSEPDQSWQGYRGHIDERVLDAELHQPAGWVYFLSGPPPMVDAMRELLARWGAESQSVNWEHFPGYE